MKKLTYFTLFAISLWILLISCENSTNPIVSSSSEQNDIASLAKTIGSGSKIVFHSGRDGNDEIYIMNADGSEQTRLTYNPMHDGYACLSQNGKKIVFERIIDVTLEIYTMNVDGSEQTNISNNPTSNDWSPDWGRGKLK